MQSPLENETFRKDYEKLASVSLNPARHTAANALAHTEMVRARVGELARLNECSDEETALLQALAVLHDIGKLRGTAHPGASVAMLPKYGIRDPHIINLVKYHDTNLPWYKAARRDEPPSDKAWSTLSHEVDLRLLCLFMVADRVDCPGGWRANRPLTWFLEQARKRDPRVRELVLDGGCQERQ